ncbi:MAG TPA: hypothetical protein VM582_10075, partial [Candidatus Thermoplasmatota archaeon]|nr:hypothetical protein [Candidatus Thermoplasmatota archaeon]
MPLPDSGNVEDFTEAEMMELVQLNETDKTKLTKSQKAAIARYNFKKNKGEAIPFKGSAAAAAQAQKTEAPTTQGGAAPANAQPPGDITAMLSP